ncbi:hypothetical protein DPEC_G00244260 [Dallia pectoralis]|uniref:Uncharacterized protein n=1 Tax=Dallia pectoralis TaxID=75939 RepID=A0ACC2FVH6_DALPE|nr:hypothetical protein DPEC_G00244260 [Dallia pectoralis]
MPQITFRNDLPASPSASHVCRRLLLGSTGSRSAQVAQNFFAIYNYAKFATSLDNLPSSPNLPPQISCIFLSSLTPLSRHLHVSLGALKRNLSLLVSRPTQLCISLPAL